MPSGDYVFGLPPSLGPVPIKQVASRLQASLAGSGISEVRVLGSYSELESELHSGAVHAAWSPPIVCARVESAGGGVALRSVRYGSTTYRSVLLCRSNSDVDLKRMGSPTAGRISCAWVDEWSMAGCILPRYYLRSRGLDLHSIIEQEMMLESYQACFEAVLDGFADLTASYAGRRGLGYVDLCGERAAELRALAYTDESPNDGVALSPSLAEAAQESLSTSLAAAFTGASAEELIDETFNVDGFDVPPPGTYSALLAFLA